MAHRCSERERFYGYMCSTPSVWIVTALISKIIQLKKLIRCVNADCKNFMCFLRTMIIIIIVLFFIHGNSIFSIVRVSRTIMLSVSKVFHFFRFCWAPIGSASTENMPDLWLSSSPAVGIFTRVWRVLCEGTLRVSTKKYCWDITIVNRGKKTSDDRHKSWTKDDGLFLKHCRDEAVCISFLPFPKKKNLHTALAKIWIAEAYQSGIDLH